MFNSIRIAGMIVAIAVAFATACPADDYLAAARDLLVSLEDYRAANPAAKDASSPLGMSLEDLEVELARPRYLSPEALREIDSNLRKILPANDAAAGRIADRIRELANRLDLPEKEWPDYCRKLAEQTAKDAPVDLAAERKEFDRQIGRFDRNLANFPASLRPDWLDYLYWPETKSLSAKEPPPADLDRLEIRWTNAPLAWGDSSLAATALEVQHFIRAARRARDPRSPKDWAALLRKFADALESSDKNHSPAERLPALAADLERHGLAGELIAAVRRKYSHPNAVVVLSSKRLSRNFEQAVDEPFDVNDYFAGTLSRGSGRLTGTLSWASLPSPSMARWQWRFEGESRSRSSGYSQGVQVGSQGTTEIHAKKSFGWKPTGFAALPASTDASTTVNFESISAGGRQRRQNAATGQVYASRPQAERDASALAKRTIDARLDGEGRRLLDRFNDAYDRGFKLSASTSSDRVNTAITRSMESEYQWLCYSEQPGGFAALRAAPRSASSSDMRLELHRSFVEGLVAGRLRGKETTSNDFADPAAPDDASADEWEISWAAEKPLSCEFADGAMQLEFRVKRFTTSDGEFPGITVRALYRPETQAQGVALVREGTLNLTLEGQKGEKISGRQLVLRQTLRRRIEKVLGTQIMLGEEELRGITGSAAKMKVVEMKCAEGWLIADVELKK